MSSANIPHPVESGGYEDLAAIAVDPGMRRLAWKLAGDLGEDALQETWYAVAQACERVPIDNLRGYFYRTLVNTSRRMHQELARGALPVDALDVEAGAFRRGRDYPGAAAPSAESDALPQMRAEARQDLLLRSRADQWPMIPACSDNPYRYREAIFAVAEAVVTGDGPATKADINDALVTADPEWFDAPNVKAATTYQRRCRAREDIRQLLARVIGREDLLS